MLPLWLYYEWKYMETTPVLLESRSRQVGGNLEQPTIKPSPKPRFPCVIFCRTKIYLSEHDSWSPHRSRNLGTHRNVWYQLLFTFRLDSCFRNEQVSQKTQDWTDWTRVIWYIHLYICVVSHADDLPGLIVHHHSLMYLWHCRIMRLTNTCYVGQTLQLILHMTPLKNFLKSMTFPDGTMEAILKELFSSFHRDSDEPLSISSFFDSIISKWKPNERKGQHGVLFTVYLSIVPVRCARIPLMDMDSTWREKPNTWPIFVSSDDHFPMQGFTLSRTLHCVFRPVSIHGQVWRSMNPS